MDRWHRSCWRGVFGFPGVGTSDFAKGLDAIKFYYAKDKPAADKLTRALNASVQELQLVGIGSVKEWDLSVQAGPWNYRGVLELWIDLGAPK